MFHLIYILPLAFIALLVMRTFFTRVAATPGFSTLVYRNARLVSVISVGARYYFSRGLQLRHVDLRRRAITVPSQEVLTADQLSVRITLAAVIQVTDAVRAIEAVDHYEGAVYLALQVAARNVVASTPVEELIEKRSALSAPLKAGAEAATKDLGVELLSVELKDLVLPPELKKAFSELLRARKEGQAALERARGESAALRNLANTAKLLEDHPALLQLRFMQALEGGGAPNAALLLRSPLK